MRLLRCRAVHLQVQVRLWVRLAVVLCHLQKGAYLSNYRNLTQLAHFPCPGRRHLRQHTPQGGRVRRHAAGGGQVFPVRSPSRPRVQRRTQADRPPVLRQQCSAGFSEEGGPGRNELWGARLIKTCVSWPWEALETV